MLRSPRIPLPGALTAPFGLALTGVLVGVTTRTLQSLRASPRYNGWLGAEQIGAASWPSGHATAAMTLALCAILAVPAGNRPTAAVAGAMFAVCVSYSQRCPSDLDRNRLWRVHAVLPLALGARVAVVAVAVGLARPGAGARFAADAPGFVVGAGTIATLAIAPALGLARAVRSA